MEGMKSISDTYEVLGKLGEGSGGVIYKAYHKRLKIEVVFKKMRNKSISMSLNRKEADILKKLHHSYLPQVLDFLDIDGDIYTVMSYIPGKSFQQLLREGERFSQNDMIRWGMQVCSALNYLHSQNPPIIHGDIKPANIMLTPQRDICLIDFNVSFFLNENTILGYTNGYSSPEQYTTASNSRGKCSIPNACYIDERADIYSVGATFYHLATGIKISDYKGKKELKFLEEHTSPAFAQVIHKALMKEPGARYQTALQMFQAFQGITKKNRNYKSLIHKQTGIRVGIVIMMLAFILVGGYGIHTVKAEKIEQYNKLVEMQITAREDNDYKEEEQKHVEAVQIYPSGLESYYQHAYSLYQQEDYKKCIEFVDYNIFRNEKVEQKQAHMSDVYYLKAESLYRLGEYQKAVKAYEQLFRLGAQKQEYYRDYAVALAYNGNSQKAEEVLQKAVEAGLKGDSIYYAKGEIEMTLGKTDEALEDFEQCIQTTDDMNMKARAFLTKSRIYEEKGDRNTSRDILLAARNTLPIQNQIQILEELAQTDIELAEREEDNSFRREAAEILQEVINQGWDSYDTYDTLVILYEKQGELDEAYTMLEIMEQLYKADYNIYKRHAFLEIDRQELKDNSDRDYNKFEEYYEKADKMYYEQLKDNNTDTEMQLLDSVYKQVKEGGWL
ncbi:protein kinase [Bariatricus massiliensis]|uniref:non-specific serine/threonine protein kinase n=1 Tax=Bariatricus massiliensis TaxID=1745713 RepID=A0ABS8DG35_9FIRM|nr:protein kinase [Bariatricus massiliensis]MCB7303952.1 protein kinase [Bariatricus massiliensis]MCB7374617.1 protein kinase [Bariatricus massiliensis]MCB7387062.1 protein kinase [Bariatricus massiliensis]MCB7411224.1 protein kinase [Bariatricus massiliensis]MCQ5252832.1 protein kinase [Bariatricus massiliensis]